MCPLAHPDGHDLPRAVDEVVPGFAAECDDVIVGCEDAVREPVVAQVLPDVLDRVQFWRSRRQGQQGDVVGDGELGGHVPPGLIDDHHRMGAGIDGFTDLGEMQVHRRGVAPRHDQPRTLAFGGADSAEDVGPFGALVVRRAGSGSALGPAVRDLVFLTYPRFILPPQLYLCSGREALADIRQLGRKSFLKSSMASSFWA